MSAGDEDRAADAARDDGPLVAQAVDAMRKVVDDLTQLLGADTKDKVAALRDASKAATENLGAIANDASELSRARLDDLSAAVRRNPLGWLAIAAGLGLIVGLWKNRDTTR